MGKYVLEIEDSFSSAHSLRGYEGRCEALHGHNWKVKVFVGGRRLNEVGILVDFKVLKRKLREILEKIDHTYLNEISPFDTVNPSSENIAYYIYKEMKKSLEGFGVRVEKVTVYESDRAGASFIPED